jgi:hypothetical protein
VTLTLVSCRHLAVDIVIRRTGSTRLDLLLPPLPLSTPQLTRREWSHIDIERIARVNSS